MTMKGNSNHDESAMKVLQHRSITLLTRMAAMKFDGVGESGVEHAAEIDYDYEHRVAEHEHEHETQTDETPEQCRPPKRPKDIFLNTNLIAAAR